MQKLTQLFVIILASVVGFGCKGMVPQRPITEKDTEFLFPAAAEKGAGINQVSWSGDNTQAEAPSLRHVMMVKMEAKASEAPSKMREKMRDARARFLYTYFPWALSDAQRIRLESEDILRDILQDDNIRDLQETLKVYGFTPVTIPIATRAGQLAMDSYYETIAQRLRDCDDQACQLALIQELEYASKARQLAYTTPDKGTSLSNDQTAALTLP